MKRCGSIYSKTSARNSLEWAAGFGSRTDQEYGTTCKCSLPDAICEQDPDGVYPAGESENATSRYYCTVADTTV